MTNDKQQHEELREPGIIRVLSGRLLDLRRLSEEDIFIEDIAWGLGRTLRYGGHILENYTVAMHSIVASYYVPEEYALEALLHDAAESYVGDIIWPVKALFPELEAFENMLALKIMKRFGVNTQSEKFTLAGGDGEGDDVDIYKKSPIIESIDRKLFQHECFSFGRPGRYDPKVEAAWRMAGITHEPWWHESTYAFLERFYQLTEGEEELTTDRLEYLTKLWFPNATYSDRAIREAEEVLKEMGQEQLEMFLPKTKGETDV